MRAHPGLRAAVNARLEEISFRTGLITAAIALVVLSAVAAGGAYAAMAGSGSAKGAAVGTGNAPAAPKAVVASASPSRHAAPSVSAKPKAAPTHAASPQPAVPAQSQVQASSPAPAGPRFGRRGYGRANPRDYGPWSGGNGSWYRGSGFPAPGTGGGWHG